MPSGSGGILRETWRRWLKPSVSVDLPPRNNGLRLLLTGDAEIEEQAQILATVGPAGLRADVLKTPHHGSAYQDPAFLAAAAPRVAFVSVGAVNPYGLPSASTLDRLASSGAQVMRTDISGDLAVVVRGGNLAVEARGQKSGPHR